METFTPVSNRATLRSAGSRRVSVSVINEWGASAMASLLAAKVKQADRLFNLYRGCTVGLLWRVRVSNNFIFVKVSAGYGQRVSQQLGLVFRACCRMFAAVYVH